MRKNRKKRRREKRRKEESELKKRRRKKRKRPITITWCLATQKFAKPWFPSRALPLSVSGLRWLPGC